MHNINTLREIIRAFSEYQREFGFLSRQPASLYQPIQYILSLEGKKLRPAIAVMAYNVFKQDIAQAMPVAAAVEIFHNFSLMHDDIMDNAPLRRGLPTVHEKWDTNTAILSGDAMLVSAYVELAKCSPEFTYKLLRVFNKVAIEVCEGQQMDMDFERMKTVEMGVYLEMIKLKTAVLLAGAAQMGAIVGGASDDDCRYLYNFALELGIAFQLQDDYLDSFGDPEKFGKKVGGDIIQNKKTYLTIKAREVADTEAQTELDRLFDPTISHEEPQKIKAVKGIYTSLGVEKLLLSEVSRYYRSALENLTKVSSPAETKEELYAFAAMVMEREK